ncbi:MAG: M61 family peptidase [Cyanobacteria bacterium J083]|nr:MAG: M61 family peptidase [Cyanobacteria bacterium J083]
MTQANTISEKILNQTLPKIFYQVAMPQPQSHLFHVTLYIKSGEKADLELKMPVWTPGSYLVREYSRHIQHFKAEVADRPYSLKSYKLAKNHWRVETENFQNIKINYQVFANELTVRTNHLDGSHGYFNGAALFFLVPGWENQAIEVEIIPPQPEWQIATNLPPVAGKSNTYQAKDFDTLVDTPFEIGIHQTVEFEVLNKKHSYVIWGKGNIDTNKLVNDTKKIIETEAKIFNGLPYEQYMFLLHLSASGYGGLEHKDSCSLNYPRFGFQVQEKYERFLQLVAHEFFHLWNVKRIRPLALEKFDYEQENYTDALWFCEGTTSYYDLLIPLRAKIYHRQTFLANLSKEISRFLTTPGRKIQTLAESSFDAWIKLYRRDANSDNCQISYYLKGEMVSLCLDLIIRSRHQNQKSLDDVMRQMWEKFGKVEQGFTTQQLQDIIQSVAEIDLTDFFHRYLMTTEEIPFNEYLQPFGLKLQPTNNNEGKTPYLGIKLKTENNRTIISFTDRESPAAIAGIDPGDELLAIDEIRVTEQDLLSRLQDYQAGDTITISLFQQDELKNLSVTLAKPQPTAYEIVEIDYPSAAQSFNLAGWLGEN